ncbi:hypothetical protein PLEOSDRAFT_1090098 [Pleurotus ostreatus PC15]|uniref:Wax synthase domain-containing protein n=1 Tax=Pleurotus ostreatus (strain PC15) TaxID=1137138 RepID=A0A067NCL7_PLEO1|nr:hypothetical protein PLEOSDRAFT_1090098 [Pleurotus ostreatus PC15]
MNQLLDEISTGGYRAFRALIPEPHDRIPVAPSTIIVAAAASLPFAFLAAMSRRPGTYSIRLLLLPSAIVSIVKVAFGYAWMTPMLNVYNWGQCLLAEVLIAKALEFTFTKEGMLKRDEILPGQLRKAHSDHDINGSATSVEPDLRIDASLITDAIDVAHTMRGLSYQYSAGVRVPPHTRPLERRAFLGATLRSFITNFLVLDLLETFLKFFPNVGSPSGGSMFYPTLPLVTRYTVSTVIHVLTGTCLLAGFGMVYDLITLLAVGVVGGSPLRWPPVMENPWISQSMHEFWGLRWHQLLRQTFLAFGGYPLQYVFKRLHLPSDFGMVFGVFLASALFHECSIYSMGKGFDPAPVIFFLTQVLVLAAERIWRHVTGRRVGGWPGTLWVYAILFFGAQPMIDSWHRRGLGGGLIIPPFLSPARLVLVPLIKRVLVSSPTST